MAKEAFVNLYRCQRLKNLHGLRVDSSLLRAIEVLTEAAAEKKSEYGMVLCRQNKSLTYGRSCEGKECVYQGYDCIGNKGEVLGRMRAVTVQPPYQSPEVTVRDLLFAAAESYAMKKPQTVCACKYSPDIRVSECTCAAPKDTEAAGEITNQAGKLPPEAPAKVRLKGYDRLVKETRFTVAEAARFCE
ncbi:MAG: hypothetical protein AB1330_03550 [Bacillota bacterium]